jgi:FlaA1/EpsC-like NDP-sugar epimerase
MKTILPEKRARSKWLILVIDQVIVCWSLALSLFVVMQFNFSAVQRGYFFIYSITYLVVTCLVFMLLKIHTGIIRYANLDDVYRIFMATMISSISYWVLIRLVITPYLNEIWTSFDLAVILNFFISSSLLILLRIYVKQGYLYLQPSKDDKSEPILIYSKTRSAIIVKHALEQQGENSFNILGYIDNDPDKVGKYIHQKKIYRSSDIPFLKNKYQLAKVIICGEDLDFKEKKMIMESCIDEGIKLSILPPPAHWVCGKLSLGQMKNLDINDLLRRDPIVLCKSNISKEIRNKRVLVTGAAGSIGSEIVRQLVDYEPALIILCDQAESPLHDLQLELADKFPESKTAIFMASVQDISRTQQLFEKYMPEFVFHAAAYKHVPLMENNPTEAIMTNVFGTKNIAELSKRYGTEKFIMISTDKAVNPTNVMGATKRLAEIYIQALQFSERQTHSGSQGTCFITTRFGNVLGSNGSVVPRFKAQIDAGGPVTVTHPDITRYFMTIPEAVELVLEAGSIGKGGEIFVFDMGEPVKIVDLAISMIKLAGLVPNVDIEVVYTGLRPGEKLYEELLSDEELTIPTHNAKIKIAKVRLHNLREIDNTFDSLLEAKYTGDEIRMIQIIKNIIPEYKSNNSLFETLDDPVTI